MIKILFLLPGLHVGGAEKVTITILKQLDPSIFDISLAVLQKEGELLLQIPNYVKIHSLNKSKTIFSILAIQKLIKLKKPDMIYSSLHRMNIAVYLASVLIKSNTVTVFRSQSSPKSELKYNQYSKTFLFLAQRAYRSADYVIAQTPDMVDEIHEVFGTKKENIKVLINPVDMDLIDLSVKEGKNPFDTSKINIIASGRIRLEKGYDILIKSFASVVQKNSRFRLHILGSDVVGDQKDLEELAKNLNLNNKITFWGHQNNPYLFYYYSDLFVLSSRWEGLPNVVLENLYLGKPIVATKCIPLMASLIKNNENGILVDVENIEQLSQAILDFSTLKIDDSANRISNTNINNFFEQLLEEKQHELIKIS
jgi:glycosyltransferase involved in cell wall biosynthesis